MKLDIDKIKNNILTKDDYVFVSSGIHKHYSLKSKIVCFFNGLNWNIINLDVMLCYPTLYFDFWSSKDNITYENTLIVCPITMRSLIYKGRVKIIDVVNGNRLYLLNTETNDEFFMDSPYTGHYDESGKEKKIKSQVKRYEVKILTLKDSMIIISDPKYLVSNKSYERSIINKDYYNNRLTYDGLSIYTTLHPKSIVYVVQYYSFTDKKYKYIVILGKDINKDKSSGYNYRDSGVLLYINQNINKFVKKKAYIYPIFWYMVDILYSDVKMIFIT